jgi:hypothetical protein
MKCILLVLGLSIACWAAEPWRASSSQIDAVYPQVEALYLDLHSNPELSFHEEKTAAKIADQLRKHRIRRDHRSWGQWSGRRF